jgi:hypothetical protein
VIIRSMEVEDAATLRDWHRRMGFDYELPDLADSPAILTRIAESSGGILAAAHFRKEAEAYLLLDKEAPARARWRAIQALDQECCPIIKTEGFSQIAAWVPTGIEWEFSHALVKLGYRKARAGFSAWCKEL